VAASDAALRAIGSKFGKSIEDFSTSSKNILEQVVWQHCKEGVLLMQKKLRGSTRTKDSGTLIRSIHVVPPKSSNETISVETLVNTKDAPYYDFVDKGVKGFKNKGKAPQSPYAFKNMATPHAMIKSFKDYIAATGSKSMRGKKLIRKNKQKQSDLITAEAYAMAKATKKSGIKPHEYISQADNPQRTKQLAKAVGKALASGIRTNIVISINRK